MRSSNATSVDAERRFQVSWGGARAHAGRAEGRMHSLPRLPAVLWIVILGTLLAPGCALDRAGVGLADDGGALDAALDAGGADACVPSAEACNDRDDDCDGLVDEGGGVLCPVGAH